MAATSQSGWSRSIRSLKQAILSLSSLDGTFMIVRIKLADQLFIASELRDGSRGFKNREREKTIKRQENSACKNENGRVSRLRAFPKHGRAGSIFRNALVIDPRREHSFGGGGTHCYLSEGRDASEGQKTWIEIQKMRGKKVISVSCPLPTGPVPRDPRQRRGRASLRMLLPRLWGGHSRTHRPASRRS